MKVEEIMSTPVVTTQRRETVEHVRTLMRINGISSVVVLNNDDVIEGIVSISDVATEIDDETTVEEVMSTKIHVVSPESGTKDAASMMKKHNVHHLVAMNDGKVVGIISSMDFVSLYSRS